MAGSRFRSTGAPATVSWRVWENLCPNNVFAWLLFDFTGHFRDRKTFRKRVHHKGPPLYYAPRLWQKADFQALFAQNHSKNDFTFEATRQIFFFSTKKTGGVVLWRWYMFRVVEIRRVCRFPNATHHAAAEARVLPLLCKAHVHADGFGHL